MGLDRERISRIRELQTQRLFTSTSNFASETMLEPSIFYTNSEHFSYNLFDFFLRAGYKPHWEARIYVSKTLYNNLIHNNNINPITYPLNITFEKLGNILKIGFIQGKVYLDHDPNGRMAKTIAEGVHFYDDKRKYFVNPNLTLASVRNDNIQLGAGGDNYTAQAITEGGDGLTIDIPYTADQRGYGHSTFIRLLGPNETQTPVMDDFKNAVVRGCGCQEDKLHY